MGILRVRSAGPASRPPVGTDFATGWAPSASSARPSGMRRRPTARRHCTASASPQSDHPRLRGCLRRGAVRAPVPTAGSARAAPTLRQRRVELLAALERERRERPYRKNGDVASLESAVARLFEAREGMDSRPSPRTGRPSSCGCGAAPCGRSAPRWWCRLLLAARQGFGVDVWRTRRDAARLARQPVASPATLVRLAGGRPGLELLVASYRGVSNGRRERWKTGTPNTAVGHEGPETGHPRRRGTQHRPRLE